MNNIKILLNYNFDPADIVDEDFDSLFKIKRHDSCFAFAYQKNNTIYAIRDHIGTVPLYFRFFNNEVKLSTTLAPLVNHTCHLDLDGLRHFIALGTPRLKPLFKEIGIVPPGTVMKINPQTGKTQIIYQYKIEIAKGNSRYSLAGYVDELERLLLIALKRTCRYDEVGLYLGGGIDAGLIGIYLKKLGVKVNAYTSAPWGRTSTEIPFAKINANKIGVTNHHIDYLEFGQYKELISYIPKLYGIPYGGSSAIGIAGLWKNSPIGEEKQVYAAHGCDTLSCSMPAQNVAYFLRFLPSFIRKRLHRNTKYKNFLQNYLSFASEGLIKNYEESKAYISPQCSPVPLLVLIGLYVVYSPCVEVLSGPLINRNTVFSDPFLDIDVIKFFLKIPLKYRIAFSRKAKTKFYFDKIIVRKLAERYLPKDLVWRKKALVVPIEKDPQTVLMVANLPDNLLGVPLTNDEFKFRAKILLDWCKSSGIRL